jgi:RNA polymerase sigma-70 factor (ECF subfamily)
VQDTEARLKGLMLRGLGGDARAYGRLLTEMSGYLRAYFGRRLGAQASEAEDLVQETLLAIHLKRDSYDPEAPFTPWAYAMARYRLLEHLRRSRRRIGVPLEDAGELFASENPEEAAVRRDLRTLLQRLTGRQRRLVVDVKLTGLSIAEAAVNSGLSAGAAKVSLHRSLKALKQAVRDEDR